MSNEVKGKGLGQVKKGFIILLCGKFFLLFTLHRACGKMKKAQWEFIFKISKIHFLKQLCLYFNYLM